MASPFESWRYDDAVGAYDELVELVGGESAFEANRAFVEEHDHWQDGDGWVGPNGGDNAEARTKILAGVERQFTPRDAISEVLDRMANALLKNEPDVQLVPLDAPTEPELEPGQSEGERQAALAEFEAQQAELAAEAEELRAVLAAWWDRRALWERTREAVKRSRWATQGVLRTWIAPSNLVDAPAGEEADDDESGQSAKVLPSGLDLADALDLVELSAPEPDVAFIHRDPDSQQEVAVFLYEQDDQDLAELWYVDGDVTVLRVVAQGGADDVAGPFEFTLGGLRPLVPMAAELLVTDPVRRLQRRLNFFESIIVRVGETAGFPERYTLNAEPSGVWLQTPPADGPALDTYDDERGTKWYLHPGTRTLGAAVTTELIGIEDRGPDGKKMRATPGVTFKEPTDPEYAAKASRHAYRALLEQCKQGHLAFESSRETSGVAYQQARADFEDDLDNLRPGAEALVRGTLEVALAWAEEMGGRSEAGSVLDRFRIAVTLRPRSGPITPAEQEQHNANVDAGTMSVETAMAANGIEDVDAELERIRNSPEAQVELLGKQVTSILELVREGVPMDLAAEIMGVMDEEVLGRFKRAATAIAEGRDQDAALRDEIDDALREGAEV